MTMHASQTYAHQNQQQGAKHYRSLALMAALSFVAMFILMYAMVDRFENVQLNLNQVYMALLMTAPMIVIELILMAHMYPEKRVNAAVIGASASVLVLAFLAIRFQVGISNHEFLRSMIPHHASAILMCERAPVTDTEIEQLCRSIIVSQRGEIAQMRAILDR